MGSGKSRMGHVFCNDPLVELFAGQVTKSESGFLEAGRFFVGFFGDLGGFVVTDMGVESGYQHERVLNIASDGVEVGFDADGAVVVEGMAAICE